MSAGCAKHDDVGSRHSRSAVTRFMRSLLRDQQCVDPTTGIADLTDLAGQAAQHFDHDEWLDDPDHWVWEAAIVAADAAGAGDHP